MSFHRWMEKKENVGYTCNGILFGLGEGNSVLCGDMDEPSEDITLSEMSLSQRDKHCMRCHRLWGWNGSHWGWGRGDGGFLINARHRVRMHALYLVSRNVLETSKLAERGPAGAVEVKVLDSTRLPMQLESWTWSLGNHVGHMSCMPNILRGDWRRVCGVAFLHWVTSHLPRVHLFYSKM